MPVKKYRDVSEMEPALWRDPGDPALFLAMARVWDFAMRSLRPRFPPGVYRHRSLEEAERLREQWEEANFRAFHSRRAR